MSVISQIQVEAKMRQVVEYAEQNFERVRPLFEDPDGTREGYAYTLRFGPMEHHIQQTFLIGKIAGTKARECGHYSREKIFRATWLDHLTSLESANADRKEYPGAIVMPPWADSISGLKGLDDHCLAIAQAARTERLPILVAFRYAGAKHEERLNKFLNALPVMK